MKLHTTLLSSLGAMTLMLLFAAPQPLHAEPIGPHTPGNVQHGCSTTGGQYFPPTKGNHGVYGCMEANGNGIVCGGAGGYSKTCSFSHAVAPGGKQPGQTAAVRQEYNNRMSAK